MASSFSANRSSAPYRRAASPVDATIPVGPQRPGIDPAPNPRPVFQLVAFAVIVVLGLLQFLPATHFRDPSDPFGNWLPFHDNTSSSSPFGASRDGNSGFISDSGRDDGMVHVVSWMDCLDLRVLAVIMNSTLTSSSYPNLVVFHFFLPGGSEDKVSFYKLKVLFPHSNLEIHGQEEVKEIIRTAFSGKQYGKSGFEEMAPFVISSIHQSFSKFIYVAPNVIIKGRVEELIAGDLTDYAVAAAEDCSERLETLVNPDVLDAIQRSASKPWISETPYAKDDCIPELSLLLFNGRKLEKDFIEAVSWWRKVLNLSERTNQRNTAVALAMYNRYLKLSSTWLINDAKLSENNNTMIIQYDGPKTICSGSGSGITSQSSYGNAWTNYLPSNSYQILSN